MSMTDPDEQYRALSLLGDIDEITEAGARDHIDELAKRYTGDDYQPTIQTSRVLLKIRPTEVIPHGGG
jgi:hypothetical protein